MKVKLNSGVEYKVSWYHNNKTHLSDKKMDNNIQLESYTICKIEGPYFSGKGKAVLAYKENYCKDYGRKIALKRTMKNIGFTKETRTMFWHEYHRMTNKPKRIK